MNQALPTRMRVIECNGTGGPEVMQIGQAAVPIPKPDEILIRVQAAGVNRPDVAQRMGAYPPPPDASPILGLEAAGEVAARGEAVSTYNVGDRVTALCNGGAYAEYVAVPATQCLPWPKDFSAVQAAALPENYFTVWANVFDIGRLHPGESLLVHGGTSGIGITAIQLAAAYGATVYATAGSPEKCAAIEKLGATAIDYKQTDFAAEIRRLTDKAGVDVILDMIGGSYTVRNVASLAPDGRLVQIAFMNGNIVENFDLGPIMRKRLTLTGSTMRPRTSAEKAGFAASLRSRIWPQLDAGLYAPIIHGVFSLDQAPEAHRLMESSAHIGKIVLKIAD